jgi:hypothetical protein
MLHLVHQRALQADHVGGQRIIEDLPAAVVQHLVAERPAAQHRVELLAGGAFAQEADTGLDAQLVGLELFDEGELFGAEFAQRRLPAQRTLLAGQAIAVIAAVSECHQTPSIHPIDGGAPSLNLRAVCLF